MDQDVDVPDALQPYVDTLRAYVDGLRPYAAAARAAAATARRRAVARPGVVAALLSLVGLAYAAYRLFATLGPGEWPVLGDSARVEYIGWYITRGNRLYVDAWGIKPPLAFEVPAVLALLSGDDVVLFHVLNVLANFGAVAVAAWAAAGIVHELTDDPVGALVAGLAPFTLAFYVHRTLIGFKAKYFIVAAGLACLYLAYRERPVAAGVAAAAAVGFWQLAVIFPLCGLGLCWQVGRREGAGRFLAAGIATGAVIFLPVVLWGAVPAMLAEIVLIPLLVTEQHTIGNRVQFIVRLLGQAFLVALVGLVGLATGLAPDRLRREWPLVVTAGWFTAQMLLLDFDYLPDLFPWFATASIGVGLAVAHRRRIGESASARGSTGDAEDGPTGAAGALTAVRRRPLAVAVLAMVVVSVATMGGFGGRSTLAGLNTYDVDRELDVEGAFNKTEGQYAYWHRVELNTCRSYGGRTQFRAVQRAGLAEDRHWRKAPCGQFGPLWDAVREKYFGEEPKSRSSAMVIVTGPTPTPCATPREPTPTPAVDRPRRAVRDGNGSTGARCPG